MEQNSSSTYLISIVSAIVLAVLLSACVPDGGDSHSEAAISGSVGDGPIVGATLNIYDNAGNLIQTEISDNSASYVAHVKAKGNAYPLTIRAVGGTDLVTGRVPDFTLTSVVLHPSQKQVNINPFSTLIEQTAALMSGGLTEQNVAVATADIMGQLNFGLNPALVHDPIGSQISDLNIAATVKASETLGEAIRRTFDALRQRGVVSSADEIVGALADDMSDGTLDGRGTGDATTLVTDVFVLASAQTLIEALSNNLHVDGSRATDALDNAILTTRPTVSSALLTASVRINGEMLQQASSSVAAARAQAPSPELASIAAALDRIPIGSVASQIEPVLPPHNSQALDSVIALVAADGAAPDATVDAGQAVEQGAGSGSVPGTDPVVETNNPPTIEGRPVLAVNVGAGYRFQPSASDSDGDRLTFDATNVPGWATFDPASGLLSGTPAESDTGIYPEIVVSVSDGQASRSLPAFSISVNATTRNSSNTAPTLSGTPPTRVLEDASYRFQPSASDADGDSLVFAISNRPSWASFDTNSGALSGSPTNSDVGTFADITVSASDGTSSASIGPFSITVVNTNDAPSISGAPAVTVDAETPYNFEPAAHDPDGDNLTFSIEGLPTWANFDSHSGRLWGTPGVTDVGTYGNIVISVRDATETAALPAFAVTVSNAAPALGSTELNWSAPVTRADGDALAMSEIAGYTLYYGTDTGNYTNSIKIDDPYTTSATVSDLPTGTYHFVITATDIAGLESGYSGIATRQIQ